MPLTAYRASAGSGKTFTLALEYLSLCLSSDELDSFQRILAVTFTNKAALELKERILDYLGRIGGSEMDEEFMNRLEQRTGIERPELVKRAIRLRERMLYRYGRIHIGTIDSFTLKVVRTFAKELGLPMDFRTSLEQDDVQELLVDQVIDSYGHDPFVTKELGSFAKRQSDEDKAWNPRRSLKDSTKTLFKDASLPAREHLLSMEDEEIKKALDDLSKRLNSLYSAMEANQEEGRRLLLTYELELKDFYYSGIGSVKFIFQDLKKLDKPLSNTRTQSFIDGKYCSSTAKKDGREAAVNDVGPRLAELFLATESMIPEVLLLSNILDSRMHLLMTDRLAELLHRLEDMEGVSLLQRNNERIFRVVRSNPAPFIYERLGERFRHFLIDEFQDTSSLQWRNLLPLISESMAKGYDNVIVGDAKQSIYRWRDSEVGQILALPGIPGSDSDPVLNDISRQLAIGFAQPLLPKNFRSDSVIVEFNNALFNGLSSFLEPAHRVAYEGLEQEAQKSGVGFVRMEDLGSDKEVKLKDTIGHIEAQIEQCLDDGYKASDIAILIRRHKEGREIAEELQASGFLTHKGITLSSSESFLISRHSGVQLLIAALDSMKGLGRLKHLLLVVDHLYQHHELPSTRVGLLRKWMHSSQHAQRETQQLWSQSHSSASINYDRLDLYGTLEQLARDASIDLDDPYIQCLLEQAWKHSVEQSGNVEDFLDRWENKWKDSLSIETPLDEHSVRIMTIHKSKGLEFKVVLIPYISWKAHVDPKDIHWMKGGDALKYWPIRLKKALGHTEAAQYYENESAARRLDVLNELYVACTRAKERIYIQFKSDGDDSLGSHLSTWMSSRGDGPILTLGQEKPKELQEEGVDDSEHLHVVESGPVLRAKRHELMRTAINKADMDSASMEFGTMIHDLLHHLAMEEDWETKLKETQIAEEIITLTSKDEIAGMIKDCEDVVRRLVPSEMETHSEVELIDPEGKLQRLDRLYTDEQNSRAIIIDFKTGNPRTQDENQISRYKETVHAMGYQDVQAHLIYTQNQQVISK